MNVILRHRRQRPLSSGRESAAIAPVHARGDFVWQQLRDEAKDRTLEVARKVKTIQQSLDRLDEAFLFAEAIDDGLVSLTFASWNRIAGWLRRLEGLRGAA